MNKPIVSIIDEGRQEIKYYFHGTTSNNLKSILDNGLKGKPVKRTFDTGDDDNRGTIGSLNIETYGGIYMGEYGDAYDISHTAIIKFGGDPLIVCIAGRPNNFIRDEDTITSTYYKLFLLTLRDISDEKKILTPSNRFDIAKYVPILVKNRDKIFNDGKRLFLKRFYDHSDAFRKHKRNDELVIELYTRYWDRLESFNNGVDKDVSENRVRRIVDRLTRWFKSSGDGESVRYINGDIGYSGTPRIVGIWTMDSENNAIVHYGNLDLIEDIIEKYVDEGIEDEFQYKDIIDQRVHSSKMVAESFLDKVRKVLYGL